LAQQHGAAVRAGHGLVEGDVQRLGEQVWKQDAVLSILGHVKAFWFALNSCSHTDSNKSGGFCFFLHE
jgi:hypothetical protein